MGLYKPGSVGNLQRDWGGAVVKGASRQNTRHILTELRLAAQSSFLHPRRMFFLQPKKEERFNNKIALLVISPISTSLLTLCSVEFESFSIYLSFYLKRNTIRGGMESSGLAKDSTFELKFYHVNNV